MNVVTNFNLVKILFVLTAFLSSFNIFAYDFEVDSLYYNILSEDDGTAEVTCFSRVLYANKDYVAGDLVIPTSIIHNNKTYKVTSIGSAAFSGCIDLSSVTIPNSVISIGNSAFSFCEGLTSVTIPNSVTTIGAAAFSSCRALTSVTIPNTVTSIGHSTFSACYNLASVTISNLVTSIGDYTFSECTCLKSITIPNSVTTIGAYAFRSCSGLKSVIIPNSVTLIDNYAFFACKGLTSATIPNSVASIGVGAFCDCTKLSEIIVDENNNYYASIDGVLYNKDISEILAFPIGNNKIEFSIPNTVTSIGIVAFYGCSSLTSISIPNSVASIGPGAFNRCNSLKSITIPNSVTTIEEATFSGCNSLKSVNIPNQVTMIGESAFYGCSSLTSITIPNSVTHIRNNAFSSCFALTSIYCKPQTPPSVGIPICDASTLRTCILYVPTGCKDAYEKANVWTYFSNIEEMDFGSVNDITIGDNTVKVINGEIFINDSADGVKLLEVYNMKGVCVYRGTDTKISNLAKGVYLVRIGSSVTKVIL